MDEKWEKHLSNPYKSTRGFSGSNQTFMLLANVQETILFDFQVYWHIYRNSHY